MITINLAPERPRRRRAGISIPIPAFNLGMLFGVVYLVALVGIGWYWVTLHDQESQLTADNTRATAELALLKKKIGDETKVKNMLPELQKRVDAIQELTKNQGRPILLFDAFVDAVPRDLWISGLEEKGTDRGTVLRVSGSAFSTTAVSDFMANLRRTGKFKDVDILVSKQDLAKTPRVVTFEVTCRFES